VISGEQLALWRNQAKQDAIAYEVSPAEVDWLLQEVAGLDTLSLRLESFKTRGQITLKYPLSSLTQLWQQRLKESVPVQYLVGVTPWRNFSLKVSPAVLIPRPETEYIIDIVLQSVQNLPALTSGNWVDLGTGSGAIAIGLAEVLTKAKIYATDSSLESLAIARENAEKLGFGERIKFYQGNWWEPLEFLKGKVSGMVSNPPYIPTGIISSLQPEVRKHEPHRALDGGDDGLDAIRYLINSSPDYIISGGIWLIEMMSGQAEIVAQMLTKQGSYTQIEIISDLSGIERFALGKLQIGTNGRKLG
jgi:release factor glutamine methyltransferase